MNKYFEFNEKLYILECVSSSRGFIYKKHEVWFIRYPNSTNRTDLFYEKAYIAYSNGFITLVDSTLLHRNIKDAVIQEFNKQKAYVETKKKEIEDELTFLDIYLKDKKRFLFELL
jgi:hypothetical protein